MPPAWLRPASWSIVGGRAATTDGGGVPAQPRGRGRGRRSGGLLSAATLVASVAALGVGMALHRREEWMEVLTAVAAAALSSLSAPSGPSPAPTPTTNPSPSPSPLQSLRSLGFDPAGYAPTTASASYPPGTASAGYPLITAYGARDLPARLDAARRLCCWRTVCTAAATRARRPARRHLHAGDGCTCRKPRGEVGTAPQLSAGVGAGGQICRSLGQGWMSAQCSRV